MDPIQEALLPPEPKEARGSVSIPEELPILPLSGLVLFPDIVAPLIVGKENYIQLIDEAVLGDKMIGVVAQKKQEEELESILDGLCRMCCQFSDKIHNDTGSGTLPTM
jgi:ATP-dependent Lon protease